MDDRYLFKAKRIDNGEWEIGSLIILPNGECEIWNRCNNPPDSDPMWRRCVITHKVEPSTICQCTGLKDDNGNLIYENDILFLKDEINGCKWKAVVEFGNPTGEYNWGWQLVQVTECEANKDILLWIETEMSYIDAEVIGNTIDNLELVESEE